MNRTCQTTKYRPQTYTQNLWSHSHALNHGQTCFKQNCGRTNDVYTYTVAIKYKLIIVSNAFNCSLNVQDTP